VAWEPFVDRGDVDGGLVADGELVIAGGDGPVALEPADPAFNRIKMLKTQMYGRANPDLLRRRVLLAN
jgi:hypothetical protein